VEAAVSTLREALGGARRVVALTGAGMSAESGVPTFRGAGGLWRNYNPQELATPEAFARHPKLVWEWYDWRRGLIAKAQPHAGHRALVELENRGGFTLITQNVDGLHDRAGSRNVVKVHGDIWLTRCLRCCRESRNDQVPLLEIPPRCPCGGTLRPGVVWFGEGLPPEAWHQAEGASRAAQVFLVIGTSAVVYPAAGLAEMARTAGARLAVLNAEPTLLDAMADRVIHGPAGEILPRLL
jgi:NAD-dependent deacetylase